MFITTIDSDLAKTIANAVWTNYGDKVSNAYYIDMGIFQTKDYLTNEQKKETVISRLTWEIPQTILGNALSHVRNNFRNVSVNYYQGATLINETGEDMSGFSGRWGITLGSYINSLNLSADPESDYIFAHEYGHTIQSQILGLFYIPVIGVPSFGGELVEGISGSGHSHDNEWYEVWSNNLSADYFDELGILDVRRILLTNGQPFHFYPDDYFVTTAFYYMALLYLLFI